MSKKDYREKIEEHRQSIEIEQQPNSRQSRSRIVKHKKPKRRDPLLATLTVIFIFIPLVVLVYIWGFYTPTKISLAEGKEESIEVERNTNVSKEGSENVITDNEVEENEAEDGQSENETPDLKQDDTENNDASTDNGQAVEQQNPQQNTNDASQANEQVSGKEYQVNEGETLYRIATNHNTTVEAIMQANGLQSPDIQAGQILIIP